MSRMLAYAANTPIPLSDAVPDSLLAQFAALAHLHSDGWGTASLGDGAVTRHADSSAPASIASLAPLRGEAVTARMLYLRFASRGAPASAHNAQPFGSDGIAFQHNGALRPREDALAMLDAPSRAALHGDTDSEVFFALVRQWMRTTGTATATARAAASLRAVFPSSCLNAMLISRDGLVVLHSRGTVAAPIEAFHERGATRLPPGHDHDYNVLRMTTMPSGATVVATSGIDQTGWEALPDDAVAVFDGDSARFLSI